MKKGTIGLLAALAAVTAAGSAQAQLGPTTPFSVEVRGGLALPVGEDMDGLEAGLVFGGDVIYQASPMIGVYGGYAFQTWALEVEEEIDFRVHGFEAGARLSFSPMAGGLTPFLKGGVLFNQAELSDDSEGTEDPESDWEAGFQLGGGVDYRLGNRLSFTPQASYNSVEDAHWINLEAGLRIRL